VKRHESADRSPFGDRLRERAANDRVAFAIAMPCRNKRVELAEIGGSVSWSP
jgi:hypothetical protein